MHLTQAKISESTWTVPLVALLLVGTFTMFYAVVSSATKTGELRRQARATHAAAVVRCDAMPDWSLGKTCRKELNLQLATDASLALAAR